MGESVERNVFRKIRFDLHQLGPRPRGNSVETPVKIADDYVPNALDRLRPSEKKNPSGARPAQRHSVRKGGRL